MSITESNNKIEIKLITDYREFLLGKIESMKNSFNQVASSFGNEITSSIDDFSKRINIKLKAIDERFAKNTEELEALRSELLSKKFDESNFNNVAMIRTLDKTIMERDLKIKELESRIRYLESNNATTPANAYNAKKEPETIITTKKVVNKQENIPVIAVNSELEKDEKLKNVPLVQDADGDIVISVSAKRIRSKTDKKKIEPAITIMTAQETNDSVESVVDEKPKKPVRKIKKASKVENEDESISELAVHKPISIIEPVKESENIVNLDIEARRLADEEALRLAEEEAAEAERIAEEQRIAEEEAAAIEQEKKRESKTKVELEKKTKTENNKKSGIGKKDSNFNKELITQEKIISKTVALKSTSAVPDTKPILQPSKNKDKQDEPKIKNGYPDKLPEIEDLNVITVNENDYYCDKNNQGVYQMINGDDIGAFLGYYDPHSETITPVEG
jgi:hypothetical protein